LLPLPAEVAIEEVVRANDISCTTEGHNLFKQFKFTHKSTL